MDTHQEIEEFLLDHLNAIRQNDVEGYRRSTHPDLSLYEWWVTPHRIDGLDFHEFLITENARKGTVFGAEAAPGDPETRSRFDLANLRIQHYSEMAVASYTLLTTTASPQGITVVSHNESRVIAKLDGHWQVIHVHKSPAWHAPHMPPGRR